MLLWWPPSTPLVVGLVADAQIRCPTGSFPATAGLFPYPPPAAAPHPVQAKTSTGNCNHDNKIATRPFPADPRRAGFFAGGQPVPGRCQPRRDSPGHAHAQRDLGRHRQRSPDHQGRAAIRHGHQRPALEPAGPGQRQERVQADPGLVLFVRRREAARPGIPGHRQRRRGVRHRFLFAGICPGRQDRQAPVDLQPSPAGQHSSVLRRGQPRRGDFWRQDLLRHPRRAPDRPGQKHRQSGVEQEVRRPRRRLHHDRRPGADQRQDQRQGAADPRQLRRRVRRGRPAVCPRSGHRRRSLDAAVRRRPYGPPERQGQHPDRRRQGAVLAG